MKKSYILLHFAVLLAGFTGVFGKLITLNEGLLVWYRVFFSAIILFAMLKLLRIPDKISNRERLRIAGAGLIITVHWILFYASIKYSNISIGVVCYCLTSFFTVLFKTLKSRHTFRLSEVFISLLTLLGIALIFHFDSSYQLGIALGVVSSAFAAMYTLYCEKLVLQYDTRLLNFYQMIAGTIALGLLLPLYLRYTPATSLLPDLNDLAYLILLAGICTVGLYVAFAEVLRRIPAFTVNLSFNLEPIYSIVIAFLFFGESKDVGPAFYAGLFCVLASVVLQTLISLKRSPGGADPLDRALPGVSV